MTPFSALSQLKKKKQMTKTLLSKSQLTQERIIEAATEEFSAYGVAGARVDRIAANAKANKSLIYNYFGSKEQLFTAVLKRHLSDVYQTVHFNPEDLGSYAVKLFDFAMDHPALMRLVMWHGMEYNQEWPLDEDRSLQAQVLAIQNEQQKSTVSDGYSASFILTLIITMASAWTAANPFGISIAPNAGQEREDLKRQLKKLIAEVSR